MKLHRIYAIILRFMYFFRHSMDRILDNLYFPALDLILWGLTSTFFSANSENSNLVVGAIITGILFWLIVYRSQYEITFNLLDDLWNKNLINLFVSPLKFSEWIVAMLILGAVKSLLSFGFAVSIAFVLYRVNIFSYGFSLVLLLPVLAINGWWIGFFVSSIIMRVGTKVQALAWSLVWAISPFAAIYYPLEVLPQWAQTVSKFVPLSYVFEEGRRILTTGVFQGKNLALAYGLSFVYVIISVFLLRASFKFALKRGLVKLY